MKAEYKLLLSVIVFVALGFSILNRVSISVARSEIEKRLKEEAKLYSVLYENGNCTLPDYFLFSRGVIISQELEPVARTKDGYIMLKTDYLQSQLKAFALRIFLWEAFILLFLGTVIGFVLTTSLRRERETENYLRFLLLLLTHKLGNFLSIQRLNLELLKGKYPSEKTINRLSKGYQVLESELFALLDSVKNIRREVKPEKIDISAVAKRVLEHLTPAFEGKKLRLSFHKAPSKIDRRDIENILLFLFDNAGRYSAEKVSIRTGVLRGTSYIAVLNDVASFTGRSGVGLELVKFLVHRNNGTFRFRSKNHSFITAVFLPSF